MLDPILRLLTVAQSFDSQIQDALAGALVQSFSELLDSIQDKRPLLASDRCNTGRIPLPTRGEDTQRQSKCGDADVRTHHTTLHPNQMPEVAVYARLLFTM